jgi:hypothetical protein
VSGLIVDFMHAHEQAQQVLERSLAKNQSSTSVNWEVLSQFGRGSETESIYGVAALLHLSRCSARIFNFSTATGWRSIESNSIDVVCCRCRQLVGTSRSTFLLLAAALSPVCSCLLVGVGVSLHSLDRSLSSPLCSDE